jgi:AcrR family transcriptional regulator
MLLEDESKQSPGFAILTVAEPLFHDKLSYLKLMENPESYSAPALRLIIAGERLLGDHGLDGISLRQIAAAAKNTNNYAVQHHFGSKENFLCAIYNRRVPALEAACRRRLLAADKVGSAGVRELLEIAFMSLLSAVDDRGEPTYARFLTKLMYLTPSEHPAFAEGSMRYHIAAEIDQRLRQMLPYLPEEIFELRFRLVASNFLFAMTERSTIVSTLSRSISKARYIRNSLDMAAAALSAPLEITKTRSTRS